MGRGMPTQYERHSIMPLYEIDSSDENRKKQVSIVIAQSEVVILTPEEWDELEFMQAKALVLQRLERMMSETLYTVTNYLDYLEADQG